VDGAQGGVNKCYLYVEGTSFAPNVLRAVNSNEETWLAASLGLHAGWKRKEKRGTDVLATGFHGNAHSLIFFSVFLMSGTPCVSCLD
jgi:hypothetical protein